MINEKSPLFRYLLFGSLYFVQGTMFAFTSNFAKPYLNDEGVDADQIATLIILLLIPFVFKIFYGMLSDRVNLFGYGHRLPYIVLALLLAMGGILIAGLIPPSEQFGLFATMLLAVAFAVALFDTAADGLAIDITPVADQGRVQSIMTSGRALGIIVLSSVIGIVATRIGYRPVFTILAFIMLVPLIWILQVREPKSGGVKEDFNWNAFRALITPAFLVFSAYGIFGWIGYAGIEGLVTFFMNDQLGATSEQIGYYGSLKGVGTIVGGLLTMFLIQWIGRRTTAVLSVIAISLFGIFFSLATSTSMIIWIAVLWGCVLGIHWTIYMVLAMARIDARVAGSMFAISMAMSNIGTAAGEGGATSLVDNIGFSPVFVGLAVLNAFVIPLLWAVFRTGEISTASQVLENA